MALAKSGPVARHPGLWPDLPAFLADLVLKQKSQLKVVHDRIKTLRDESK